MAKTKIIHVAVEPKMAKQIKEQAKELDASVSVVIRNALSYYFTGVRRP